MVIALPCNVADQRALSRGESVSSTFFISLGLNYYYFSAEISVEESFKSTLSIFGGHVKVDKTENIVCKSKHTEMQYIAIY